MVPGIHFSENGKKFVRVNIARKPNEIVVAIDRIKKFIEKNG